MLNKELTNILKTMKLNDVEDKDKLVKILYSKVDVERNYPYVRRRFDTLLCDVKKKLKPLEFDSSSKHNIIKRIA